MGKIFKFQDRINKKKLEQFNDTHMLNETVTH